MATLPWVPCTNYQVSTVRLLKLKSTLQWNKQAAYVLWKIRQQHNYSKIHWPFPFTNPVSTTYLTPGIVIDVSAMFVARITFRFPRGAEMNTFIWCCDGRAANMGHTRSSGHSVNRKKQHINSLNWRSYRLSKSPLLLYRDIKVFTLFMTNNMGKF